MDELKPLVEDEYDYAMDNNESPFEKALPKSTINILVDQKRIIYLSKSGTTMLISLNGENRYHKLLFEAYVISIRSEWFQELAKKTKHRYLDVIRNLFDWINSSGQNTTDKSRYSTLKDYECYVLNERGLKISPLPVVKTILREGINSESFKNEDYKYLLRLLSLSKPARKPESNPPTLSSWFDVPWIRSIIGEKDYLTLESPRRLFNSFRVTTATTLLWLLEQRELCLKAHKTEFDSSYTYWYYDWCPLLFQHIVEHSPKNQSSNDLSELAFLDLVKPGARIALKLELTKFGSKNMRKKIHFGNGRYRPWMKPIFFDPAHQDKYTKIEELLCGWLAACEAIQPTDIPKLKKNNYARVYNRLGRLVAMECTYYKGRADTMKKPNILMGGDIWTQALEMYLTELPSDSLFLTNIASGIQMPSLLNHISKNSVIALLLSIWELESFQERLNFELRKAKASPIFSTAMLALKQGGKTYQQSFNQKNKTVDEYHALEHRPLPLNLFTLTHIKNTAVHAGSDQYRDEDLVNNHSHTSRTEKLAYMTDTNKEWVNQTARVTRIIINDLQHVVFQPSITAIEGKVKDLELRTIIGEATDNLDIVVHSVHQASINTKSDETILVLDTVDSALYFIHYIKQAETKFNSLLSVRPDWVEYTLIVEIEWMSRMLSRMKATAKAQKTYPSIAPHLPPFFDHLMETIE